MNPGESVLDARARYLASPAVDHLSLTPSINYQSGLRLTADVLTPFLPGLMLVHRRVFDKLGFDGQFDGNAYREETDFVLRAQQSGFQAARCPHAMCYHLHRTEVFGGGQHRMPVWRYELSAAMNNWRFLKRHGDYLRSKHGVRGSNAMLEFRFVLERALAIVRARRAARLKKNT
jgi:GT2 family glycosyltransferase